MSAPGLLAHRLRGAGEPALFLNGGMMTMASWEPIARPLEERFAVLLCDFRGQLLSPGTPHATLDSHVADVVALLDHLGLGSVRVLATSFGAEVALALAATRPERVRSLTAVAAVASFGDGWAAAAEPILAACRAALAGGDRGPVLDAIAEFAYSPAWRAVHGAELRRRRGAAPDLPSAWFEGLIGIVSSIGTIDLASALPRISAPVHVVAAELDAVMPLENVRALAEAIPIARLTVVPGAGHALVAEDPARVVDLFLSEVQT